MSELPTPTFPLAVDQPIAQNANFKRDKSYVAYVDSQIRTIQGFLIGAAYVALPDANAALSSTATASRFVFLSGTLTAPRVITIPTQLGAASGGALVNETTQTLTFVPSSGGASSFTLASGAGVLFAFDGQTGSLFALATTSGGGGGGAGDTENANIIAAGTTLLARPASGRLYVPVDSKTAGAPVVVKAWTGAVLGDRIAISDVSFFALTHSVTFDGNGVPISPWGTQTPNFSSNQCSIRFNGDTAIIVYRQIPSLNSGNPFWFPIQGQ